MKSDAFLTTSVLSYILRSSIHSNSSRAHHLPLYCHVTLIWVSLSETLWRTDKRNPAGMKLIYFEIIFTAIQTDKKRKIKKQKKKQKTNKKYRIKTLKKQKINNKNMPIIEVRPSISPVGTSRVWRKL